MTTVLIADDKPPWCAPCKPFGALARPAGGGYGAQRPGGGAQAIAQWQPDVAFLDIHPATSLEVAQGSKADAWCSCDRV